MATIENKAAARKNAKAAAAATPKAAKAAPKLNKAANDAAKKVVGLHKTAATAEFHYLDARLALSVQVARFWQAASDAGFPNFKAAAAACKVAGWPGYDSLKVLKSVGVAELEAKGAGAEKLAWLRMKSAKASDKAREGGAPGKVQKAMDVVRGLSEKGTAETLRTLAQETGHVVVTRDDMTELAELRKDGAMPASPSASDVLAAFKALKPAQRNEAFAGIVSLMSSLAGAK
jgi:hypothetical protein|tara:strand:- start:397 stop:1092 length:696 start_codon:yes stop_codon:yes gene_type:complete